VVAGMLAMTQSPGVVHPNKCWNLRGDVAPHVRQKVSRSAIAGNGSFDRGSSELRELGKTQ